MVPGEGRTVRLNDHPTTQVVIRTGEASPLDDTLVQSRLASAQRPAGYFSWPINFSSSFIFWETSRYFALRP